MEHATFNVLPSNGQAVRVDATVSRPCAGQAPPVEHGVAAATARAPRQAREQVCRPLRSSQEPGLRHHLTESGLPVLYRSPETIVDDAQLGNVGDYPRVRVQRCAHYLAAW